MNIECVKRNQRYSRSESYSCPKSSARLITHELDEILYEQVPQQPLEPYGILGSKVKVTGVFWCFSVCEMLQLPANSTYESIQKVHASMSLTDLMLC